MKKPTKLLKAKLLEAMFRSVYRDLLGDEGDDEEEGAWSRFQKSEEKAKAATLIAEVAPDLVSGISRAEVTRRIKPIFDVIWDWAVGELADQVLFEPGNGLLCRYELRADGTLECCFISDSAAGPAKPTGRPQEN
jgi:hypothetical protein